MSSRRRSSAEMQAISPTSDYSEHGHEGWSSETQKTDLDPEVSPLSLYAATQSPDLESIWSWDQGKEVVPPEIQQQQDHLQEKFLAAAKPARRRLICGIPLALFWLLVVFLMILAVGIGAGIAVALRRKSSASALSEHPSTSGAFNGTGLAIASYSFATGGYGLMNVYFQHWTGQIRRMQLMDDGSWQGGDLTNVVATDAKNATPISAVAYAVDKKSTWHIFYIDKNNIIREKISDNTTNQWRRGPIGDLNLVAMDHPVVGLQACWYGSFYGNSQYAHSPVPGTGSNATSPDAAVGIHLWYGRDPVTLSEVNWTYNTTRWFRQDSFSANGHAGIGCYSWGPGSVTYMMMVNLNNVVQVIWKDRNASAQATSSHPVNQWANTSVIIPGAMPNTSLGYTNFLYAQLADSTIAGYNISFAAENTRVVTTQNFKMPRKPLPGTHFSVTAIPNTSGGNTLLVFDQKNGSDITENRRDLIGGQWAYGDLPVPDS